MPEQIDRLPTIALGKRIYDPKNPEIQAYLDKNWFFGYNPLAVDQYDQVSRNPRLRLELPDGSHYDYSEPSHTFEHYRKNRDGQPPKFLGHITRTGWIEYALAKNNGNLGKPDGIWTAAWDPGRWFAGENPKDHEFTKPTMRFVELIFNAEQLRDLGFQGKQVPGSDYYKFDSKIPLDALVPTSKVYLTQVLRYTF